MESEGSWPCSQEPAIGPYPVPDESTLHTLQCSFKIVLLSFSLHLGFSVLNKCKALSKSSKNATGTFSVLSSFSPISPTWFLPVRLADQNFVSTSYLSNLYHMLCSSHPPWFSSSSSVAYNKLDYYSAHYILVFPWAKFPRFLKMVWYNKHDCYSGHYPSETQELTCDRGQKCRYVTTEAWWRGTQMCIIL
jgi:hypothetical protein